MRSKISVYLLTLIAMSLGVVSCGNSQVNNNIISQGDILHQSETYLCDDESFRHPTLVFHSDLGNAPLIQFQYDVNRDWYINNPEWTPLDRCHEVTARFQDFQKKGIISYLTVEDMPNGAKAICISKIDADHLQLIDDNPHDEDIARLLITVINPNDNAEEILEEIKGISSFDNDSQLMNG